MILGSDNRLLFTFDDLNSEVTDYYYTIIHCDKNWQSTNLLFSDFAEGFEENPVEDYENSFNTFVKYRNYRIVLPNDDVIPLISGNYIFYVYEKGRKRKPVFTQRFFISEESVNANLQMHRATNSGNLNSGQRVDIQVNIENNVEAKAENISLVVQQNGHYFNALYPENPNFINGSELSFHDDEKYVFPALNEFRNFEIKSERFESVQIKEIKYEKPHYHVYLHQATTRNYLGYSAARDINGKYYINRENSQQSEVDADYFYVHFSLKSNQVPNAEVFVMGSFNQWTYTEENRMKYNIETKNYEATLLLKQGFYNYMFQLWDKSTNKLDFNFFEGSYNQTENEYLVYVYDTNPVNNYHKLLCIKLLSTNQ